MIQSVLEKGIGLMNEDALIINDKLKVYGVIDGVTSLAGVVIDGKSPGFLASQVVKQSFESTTLNNLDKMTIEANANIQRLMDEMHIEINKKADRFQCCHAVVQLKDDKIFYTSSADCVIYTIGDTVQQIVPTFKKDKESKSVSKWLKKYPNAYELKALPEEMIQASNTAKEAANEMGGYSVMNGDVLFNQAFNAGEINKANITHILITTDGFYDIENVGLETFVRQSLNGLDVFLEDMITKEIVDKTKTLYPRVKVHDDKAAVLIKL
ncbi:hypothetical protein [Macrococcus sp. DPC7161]|uniref:hypothetical protein n=1 Tax=Macrococcus sp. DPC7161 TaxID=2507060 RepID=UPI00100B7405|nr:hypothetical protein [Macrococcus sp. DPC7161]RXK17957.1 hypothetical protein ER639_07175 [Macrococcus sp. DPC7161]